MRNAADLEGKFNISRKMPFISIAIMLFFWTLADTVISYFTPILIVEHGISETAMGLIYAAASAFGAVFDFLLSKTIKISSYRRMFLGVFIIYFLYPIFLSEADTWQFFLLIMGIWGLFYDLITFGEHEFIVKESSPNQYASSHAFIGVLRILGSVAGFMLAGYLIASSSRDTFPFVIMLLFFFGFIFLCVNWITDKNQPEPKHMNKDGSDDVFVQKSLTEELKLWFYIWKKLKYVLIFISLFFVIDAVIWTIGPLLSNEFEQFPGFGGLFLAVNTIPPLFINIFIGKATNKFGKKKVAFISMAGYCALLSTIGFISNPLIVLTITFIASSIGSFSLPAIKGAISDYLSESRYNDNQILGIYDLSTNIGYIIGPIFAGISADLFGNMMTFSIVSLLGAIISVALMLHTPKNIDIECPASRLGNLSKD